MSEFTELDELVKNCDYRTKLAITAWVMENIVDNAIEGGTFRYLIYNKMGFGGDAYMPLYLAGGMTITNELDLKEKSNVQIQKEDTNNGSHKSTIR